MTALTVIGGLALVLALALSWPISGCLFDWIQARRRRR